MVGETLSHFRITGKIGAGGMGEVYRAEDTKLNRIVALKILPSAFGDNPERMRRFVREAKAASSLSHPNIGHIYEIDEANGIHFIAMEFVEGQTLSSRMKQPLEIEEIIDIASQVGDALDEAHSKSIIHRDIKPANIMITSKRLVKVLDFGLAKIMKPPESENLSEAETFTVTTPGEVFGTLAYMSPEQMLGKKLDHRTDIFSLGVVLYQMVTGQPPFAGKTVGEIADQIIRGQPAAISRFNYDTPPQLERIIRKCLEKDAERRYQSAGELAVDLKNLKRDLATGTEAPIVEKHTFWYEKRRWTIPFFMLALLLLIALGYLLGPRIGKQQLKAGNTSLAVLPFHILSSKEDGYLSVGIADSIITKLANVKQLRLSPTNSILKYENQRVDLKEAGKNLQVQNILSGTVQKAGDQFRITVQLVQVEDGTALWGEHYDLAREDLLTLEDKIAERISTTLQIRLSAAEREKLYRRYTQNVAAYESYLQGRYEFCRYSKDGTMAALEAYQNSLRLDQNYGLAQAGLAMASAQMHLRYASRDEVENWGNRAVQEARRALQLDPNLAEAHEALAAIYRMKDFNWAETIQESKKALELNPTLELPDYYIGAAYYHLGLMDLVYLEVQKGFQIGQQFKVEGLRTLGAAALLSGKSAEALKKFEEIEQLTGKPMSDVYLPYAYYYLGERERAKNILQKLKDSASASTSTRARAALASFLSAEEKKEETKELIDSITSGKYMDHHVAYALGSAYAQLGQQEEAIRWLRQANSTGLPCYPLFAGDPLLDPMRKSPEFQQLLDELRQSLQSARNRYAF